MATTLLKLTCPDRVGLLARVTGFVAGHGGNLREVHQFTDERAGRFFARLAIDSASLRSSVAGLRSAFEVLADELGAEWSLWSAEEPRRMVVLVSKLGHCLADLLWRWRSGELRCEIPCVISNHEDFREMVEREGIPFRCVPVEAGNKEAAFGELGRILADLSPDLVVLARYMQVLPADLCEAHHGRILNIHHSFLPSFVGANPYQRAWERGVKLIGATCHYATPDLDQGPIIDQEVTRVEHFHSPEDLVRIGRDCERLALARGVRWHLGGRVWVSGNRTVVFRD